MNLDKSIWENSDTATAYRRNQIRSAGFLIGLAVLLAVAALLSLRAGSYDTPVLELVKGVLDRKSVV